MKRNHLIHRGSAICGPTKVWGGILGGVALLVALGFLGVTPSEAGILGSAHDFSLLTPQQEICLFCHTPHGADISVTDAPLWNHQVSSKVFQVYNSPSLDAVTAQPSGASRLCLSCHDGTVAVDSYGGESGNIFLTGDVAVGADDLANDHPISFTFDDALAAQDGGLHSPSGSASGLGGTIAEDLLLGSQMECSSCHDVHNGFEAEAVNDSLLRITRAQSQLCLTCHDK